MSILLENLTKSFDGHRIVNHVSLEVNEGELFVLLGSSGSGKSTILRMIAGLTQCDTGKIVLDGRDVTHLSPQSRNIGYVFQNYSIFRHMTVAQNIEFGLKIRKMPLSDRSHRRDELLDLVNLAGFGDRYPDQISGGQQQRVALARALAYEPSVLLLDEPLGALDVKIRAQLRRSLKTVQRRLRIPTILVTHDQEEAFELGDRIAVLERGVLLEVDVPEKLYMRPKSFFVAGFLGGGTVLAGLIKEGAAHFGHLVLPVPEDTPHEEAAPVELLIRPEQVTISEEPPPDGQMVLGKGKVIEQIFTGAQRRLRLRLAPLSATRQISPVLPFGEEGMLVDTIVSAKILLKEEFWVNLNGWTILKQSPPRILVVDIGEGSHATLSMARQMADAMNGTVSVLGWSDEKSDKARMKFEKRLAETGLAGAEIHIRSGKLVELVEIHRAGALFDLIILPRRIYVRSKSLDPAIVNCLEHADIPVLIPGESDPEPIKSMLVCTRAGEPGKNDIRFGGRFARHLKAEVSLLHITRETGALQTRIQDHLQRGVTSLALLEIKSEVLIRSGQPGIEILNEAKKHNLVVIGGHGPVFRSVFGNDDITMKVINNVRKPVLVIPNE